MVWNKVEKCVVFHMPLWKENFLLYKVLFKFSTDIHFIKNNNINNNK